MPLSRLEQRIGAHLQVLYPDLDPGDLTQACLRAIGSPPDAPTPVPHANLWSECDCVVITYGDSLRREGEAPLHTLHQFLNRHLADCISTVHVLPFFPYSSDDGFSVMDYSTVSPKVGDWDDVSALARDFTVMADLVINHCSSRSKWFENFKAGVDPGASFFVQVPGDTDVSAVIRPRTSNLLREVETVAGTRHVWCTFSEDQVDLDFRNPEVLLAFLRIIRLYLEKGITWFRLDAVAFLWKELGTRCINLPQTHQMIRLLRLLIEHREPAATIITETNIPNNENLTYFGNANEAHMIYNFSLPPLLINTLITGNCTHLKNWLMTMPPAQHGTAYFNFIASHDGVGLRPVEGLLTDWEVSNLIQTLQRFGARVSTRTGPDGQPKPYEINVSLFDALKGTVQHGPDPWQIARYLCAHAIMLGLEGIPAIYIHSLVATENDEDRVTHSGHLRSINRHLWQADELEEKLSEETHHREVFNALRRLIKLRCRQPAFHPNASQFLLQLGESLFGFWRQSVSGEQSVFAIYNITDTPQRLSLAELNLLAGDRWHDLIRGQDYEDLVAQISLAPYQFLWLTNVDPGEGD